MTRQHLPQVSFPLNVIGGISGRNFSSPLDTPCRTNKVNMYGYSVCVLLCVLCVTHTHHYTQSPGPTNRGTHSTDRIRPRHTHMHTHRQTHTYTNTHTHTHTAAARDSAATLAPSVAAANANGRCVHLCVCVFCLGLLFWVLPEPRFQCACRV
jgi:hypothetical protein